MSKFSRVFVITLAFTVVTAALSAGFAAMVDHTQPDVGQKLIGRWFGDNVVLFENGGALEPVDETFDLQKGFEKLDIEWPLGNVTVIPLPPGQTTARLSFRGEATAGKDRPYAFRVRNKTLEIQTKQDDLSLRLIFKGSGFGGTRPHLDLQVELPATWTGKIEIATVSGNQSLGAFDVRKVEFETISGDIETDPDLVANKVSAQTVSGDLNLAGNFADVELDSVSGDIHLRLPKTGRWDFDFATVSGEIKNVFTVTKGAPGKIDANTVSGDIEIGSL